MKWWNLAGALALTLVLGACGSEPEDTIVQQEPVCSEGDTLCGTSCVDIDSDVRHCGACGVTCSEGQVCSGGECVLLCPEGQEICDSACFRLETSADHCGACGNACADGQVCADGSCVDSCPAEQTSCEGGCFDIGTSVEHCGACGEACGLGEVCMAGACVANCRDGLETCDGGCYDLDASRNHCGACGNSCDDGEVCSEGSCVVACPAGQEECEGGCFDLDDSFFHCGACGVSCSEGEACVEGACVTSCGSGLTDCDGTCRNLDVDPNACGACGNVCTGDEICIEGTCELHCATGLTACDDGTCRDLARDQANCGACGNTCADGELCIDGACELSCTGFAQTECEGSCTNTDFDRANCGACGNACAADEVCSNGACVGTCDVALDVCPGGCTDLDIDPMNCGACGTVCPAAPGMNAVCVDGTCASTCTEGFADCDNNPLNGCEIPLAVDPNNCGACGVSCDVPNASASCMDGVCTLAACTGDWVDCDGDPLNGCEANFALDPNNCGGCGIECPAGESCVSGVCEVAVGEDCNTPIQVTRGLNTIHWNASVNNYIVTRSSCNTVTGDPTGGDIVLQYDSPAAGTVNLHFVKQSSNRYEAIVSDAACGNLQPELACISDWSPAFMEGSFQAEAGKTYWIYVTDTTSGTAPLLNPLEMTLTHEYCGGNEPAVSTQSPEAGTTLDHTRPNITLGFGMPVRNDVGTITVVGNMGTNLSIQLPSPDVVFTNSNKTMQILHGVAFNSGEQLTVTATGIQDVDCGGAISAPITWSFTLGTVPCAPGQGGMLGGQIARVPVNMAKYSLTEYYVEPDQDPNGWVYVGGTGALYRIAKNADRIPENIYGTTSLTTSNLGYALLVDGLDIYTLESKTSGTDGHLWRISSDGGATWVVEDAASFPAVPGDDFRGMALHGTTMFLVTSEGTAAQATEIWSVDLSGTLPGNATMLTAFGSNAGPGNPYLYCSAIDVDSTYIYTICRQGSSSEYALLRFDRLMPGDPVELVTGMPGNITVMAMRGHDTDADGLFDFFYITGDAEEGHFVCNPGTAPYFDVHYSFGTGTSNYGHGLDRVNGVIWSYDDDSEELVRIQ